MAQAGASKNKIFAGIIAVALLAGLLIPALKNCGGKGPDADTTAFIPPPPVPRVVPPKFVADSAYSNIEKQVSFGPRVPGTPAQTKCAAWFESECKRYGLTTTVQEGVDTTWDNVRIPIKNVFAQYKPERTARILILAHWDSRPYADRDSVDKNKPILGADDGASGAGVMLEIARVLQTNDPNIGVDFLFTDAEDWGARDDRFSMVSDQTDHSDSWCLGTQYWARNKPQNYTPRFGILLDMVSGKGALFPKEGTSTNFARNIVDKVWSHAQVAGYGQFFVANETPATTDDHLYVNALARIPCIDIVNYNPSRMDYPTWHHRHSDTMDNIDKGTLTAVGSVLLETIFNEEPPALKK